MGPDECRLLRIPLKSDYKEIDSIELDRFKNEATPALRISFKTCYRFEDASQWNQPHPDRLAPAPKYLRAKHE